MLLCAACGSLVVGVARDCGSSLSLLCGGVVIGAFSHALLFALVHMGFQYFFQNILLSVSMSGESWYTTKIFKHKSQFSRLGMNLSCLEGYARYYFLDIIFIFLYLYILACD